MCSHGSCNAGTRRRFRVPLQPMLNDDSVARFVATSCATVREWPLPVRRDCEFRGGYRTRKLRESTIPGVTWKRADFNVEGAVRPIKNDDSRRLIVVVTRAAAILSNLQSTLSTFNTFRPIKFPPKSPFSSTYVCHDVWHDSCLLESCDASNQL
jgi:hypothetical protein